MTTTLPEHLTRIWTDVLGSGAADSGSTFFELGGQSVSAVRMATRIEEELDIWIDVGLFFDDPDLDTFVQAVLAAASTPASDDAPAA